MPSIEVMDWEPTGEALGEAAEQAFTSQTASATIQTMAVAKQKRNYSTAASASAHAPKRQKSNSPSKTRQLLAEALEQPEGSGEERQAFSLYLKALHDVHAK
jgi:hypothetical protein